MKRTDHPEYRETPAQVGAFAGNGGPFRLTFSQLLACVAIVLPVVIALRASMATIDLAYQIRAGNIMLDTHRVLRTDLFTFTESGRPWLNQQWGGEILLALLFRAGGWAVIDLARAVIVATSFWLLYLACRARGAGIRPAAWLSLGALLVAIYGFVPRPQMFAFLLFALTLWIVAKRIHHPPLLWLLPPVTLVWANLHGSFILLPGVLFLTWLEDRQKDEPWARTTALAALACVAAATVNPYGLRIWRYVIDLSTNPEVRRTIEEWQPPRPTTPIGFVFFASVIAVAAIVVHHRRLISWPRLLTLAAFFVIGATAVRGIIWWALAAPIMIADVFPDRTVPKDEPRAVNTAIGVLLAVVAVGFLPWFRPLFTSTANSGTATDGLLSYSPNFYTSVVAARVPPGARIFVSEIWASWFEFQVPQDPVMIDPRIELFSTAIWNDYDDISNAADGGEQILARWKVDVLALSDVQQPDLISAIRNDPNWDVLYEDHNGVLLIRKG
jgi:hypothetical protein